MRADRLLSIMMLLQASGKMTAGELARELEVSPRTIYRDIEALGQAGVPVYAEPGPGGGCGLLEPYRTSLTGLEEDEVRALLMLSIPEPLAALGMGQELRSALLKLSAALPEARRRQEADVRQRILLDWTAPAGAGTPSPVLSTIYRAVWDDRRLRLTYRSWFGAQIACVVDPLGLVAHGGDWYLVYGVDGTHRPLNVAYVLAAEPLGERVARPAAFDLATTWRAWRAAEERRRTAYHAVLAVTPEALSNLPHLLGRPVSEIERSPKPIDAAGSFSVTLGFESLEAARTAVLALGGAASVLEPAALRHSVLDYAEQVLAQRSAPGATANLAEAHD